MPSQRARLPVHHALVAPFAAPMVALCALALAGAAVAATPHQHGVARLDIATDPARVSLVLQMPLDSLLGFERAPRSDAERQQAAQAVARLRDGGALFRIDPAAGCKPGAADLQSAALGVGGAAPNATEAAKDSHVDLDASYEFTCTDGNRAAFVDALLFDAFPRLQRLDVQAATRRGQLKATLKRPVTRVPLAR